MTKPVLLYIFVLFGVVLHTSESHARDEIAKLCFECHTADNNNPDPIIPKLIGQDKLYMLREMNAFKTGKRFDTAMTDIARNLTDDKELIAIISYFSSQPVMVGEPSDDPIIEKGKYIYTLKHCEFCHGIKGKLKDTFIDGAPVIGGQNKEYTYKTMLDLRAQKRPTDPYGLMQRSLLSLSSEEMEAISAYLAAQ